MTEPHERHEHHHEPDPASSPGGDAPLDPTTRAVLDAIEDRLRRMIADALDRRLGPPTPRR